MASSMENALNLAKLLGGAGGSTTTSTASKAVSQDVINALIKKQLESTSGLAPITGGERTAGLYNSTVAQQLTNDLLARTAGEAAGQTASTTQTQKVSGAGGGKTALTGLGLLALTDKEFKKSAKETVSSLADVLSGLGQSGATVDTGTALTGDVLSSAGFEGLPSWYDTGVTAAPEIASTAAEVGTTVSNWWDSLWG